MLLLPLAIFWTGIFDGSYSGVRSTVARSPTAKGLSAGEMAGTRVASGFPGTHITPTLRRSIRLGRIGGVILFSRNIAGRSEVRRLIHNLQTIPRPAGLRGRLLVMVDQEGGLVKRLGGAPSASAETMGAKGRAYSKLQGRLTGRSLRNAGFNVDLAPVVDVGRPGGNIEDTDRAFGSTSVRVRTTAIPFAREMQKAGVSATAKHFPGLGAVKINTDDAAQKIRLSKDKIRRVDEGPFRAFAEAGGDVVMVNTAIYPAFSGKPAAFSRKIATHELRGMAGFKGVSITDDLLAAAALAYGGPPKSSVDTARAGVDIALFSELGSALDAQRAMRRKLVSGGFGRPAFVRSVNRVLALRGGTGN